MAEALQKTVANANQIQVLTQPGGMFTTVTGVDRSILSAQVVPHGMAAMLPAYPSNVDDPRYGYWTGYGDIEGSNPDYVCDDAPYINLMKSGYLTSTYGFLQAGTPTIEPTALALQARTANTDLQLLGTVLNAENNFLKPPSTTAPNGNILSNAVAAQMVGVGIQFERKLLRMLWAGNPANNSAHGGYKEFRGLDLLIKTGHVDADTSTAIPAIDSTIINFNDYVQPGDNPTKDIVYEISHTAFMLEMLAQEMGMDPVTWVLAMPRELFFELTAIWACSYLTSGCASYPDALTVNSQANEIVRMRWEMYNGQYLILNGKQWPVVLDDAIVKTAGTGTPPSTHMSTQIYFLPLYVMGRFPALYWQYVNYQSVMADVASIGMPAGTPSFWTDSGRFVWAYDGVYTCFKLKAMTAPRLILRTPHFAAKIQNVWYKSSTTMRSGFPDEDTYVGGGVSTRS